jgi:hypothetical protein
MIRIGTFPLCRACCEQIRIEACERLDRKFLPAQIGTNLQTSWSGWR